MAWSRRVQSLFPFIGMDVTRGTTDVFEAYVNFAGNGSVAPIPTAGEYPGALTPWEPNCFRADPRS